MRICLAIAPMTQLNTPYPSTAQLLGYLKEQPSLKACEFSQVDFSLELFLKIFSRVGLKRLTGVTDDPFVIQSLECIDSVIRFLQGKDPTLAYALAGGAFLPTGPRAAQVSREDLALEFGALGVQDQAKYLASLFIDDWADWIRAAIDPRFELVRYAEKLAASQPLFAPLKEALESSEPTLIDQMLDELVLEWAEKVSPSIVALSAPFAGNAYGAFRIARTLKNWNPEVKTILGGGYPNTELRELRAPEVFDYFDFVTLDDGEAPLQAILEYCQGKRLPGELRRTFVREQGEVKWIEGKAESNRTEISIPSLRGLALSSYVSLLEMPNPMHRLWSDGRWNKLAVAHGCYWKKCAFCDTSLDYIQTYTPKSARAVVDQMEALAYESGQSGFHFVDEAAPPALLKGIAEELIERRLKFTWWGNVRFEKAFTPGLAELLAESGCIALTGGLEVASDRLLKLMQKGVSVEQVAKVTHGLTNAGILVHAYLMYGFPSQTLQETIDSLERVRQLFKEGCLQSAFWHRFALTVHSPIGKNPKKFGIEILSDLRGADFARNDVEFKDPKGCSDQQLQWLGKGLHLAVYNYMRAQGLDEPLSLWFGKNKIPKPKVAKRLVAQSLRRS